MRKIHLTSLLLLLLFSPSLWAQGLSDLRLDGSSTENYISPESFHKLRLVHLPDAKVLYINHKWLHERGLSEISNEALLKKELIEAFAWVTEDFASHKNASDRIGLTDYYGGTGMGTHFGSARAAIIGEVQIKGVGKTPVYSTFMDRPDDGRAGFHEAIKEVVWGEHFNQSLPFGANRVIALIDTGQKLSTGENHVLILRENPLRAGHYVRRSTMTSPSDTNRAKTSLPKIESILIPHSERRLVLLNQIRRASPLDFEKHAERIKAVDELMFRNSAQVARSHAYKLFHGAVSESNINLDGSFIDYGTASSNSGYGRIRFLSFGDSFGDRQETSRHWGHGLAERLFLDIELKIDQADLAKVLEETWDYYTKRALHREFVSLTGLPSSSLRKLEASFEFQDFGKSLVDLAKQARGSRIDIQNEPVPELTGNFDLSKLIILLAENAGHKDQLMSALNKLPGLDEVLKLEVVSQWLRLYEQATNQLTADEKLRFQQNLLQEAKRLNQNQPELYRDQLKSRTSKLMKAFNETGDAEIIQSEVDSLLSRLEGKTPNKLSRFYGRPPYCRALFR